MINAAASNQHEHEWWRDHFFSFPVFSNISSIIWLGLTVGTIF